MSGRKAILVVMAVVIFALSRYAALNDPRHPEAARLPAFGRYTAQQMIDRATPIFRSLLPQQNQMVISAESCAASENSRERSQYWNIDCANEQGEILAYLVCDAVTGDVCNVKCNELISDLPAIKRAHTSPAVARQALWQAGQRAREWLRILGYAANWRTNGVIQHSGSIQSIRLSTRSRRASLLIDASTGILLYGEIN